MKLFNFRWPNEGICQEQELYYRAYAAGGELGRVAFSSEGLEIKKGTVLSFDTYFNCFSYSKYLAYTTVSTVAAVLRLKGEVSIRLLAVRRQGRRIHREVLASKDIHTESFEEVRLGNDFSMDRTIGFYYIEVRAISDGAVLSGAYYASEDMEPPNNVKAAVIICTYKREAFLYRNMEMAERYIFQNADLYFIAGRIKFFIIDNGKTIPEDRWDKNRIQVFPNKNYGGSGGFTRGIIEAHKRKDEFTHFLLMDDDIIFDAETLAKTVSFLRVIRPEHKDLCIGASMLRLDLPFLQHEAGGVWRGKCVSVKHNLDLRSIDSVLENEVEEKIDYQGWWYMCMPLSVVDQYKLPLPLFINSDDVDYGLRTVKRLALMNGIGIWHPDFDSKYNRPVMSYYVRRNHMIVDVLHCPRAGLFIHWLKFVYGTIKLSLRRQYMAINFINKAYEDFLQGIDFFLTIDEELLHRDLLAISSGTVKKSIRKTFRDLTSMTVKMIQNYPAAARSFRKRQEEISSLDFWCQHLDIPRQLMEDK
ncbi:hypothetical protein TREPR_2536 [Treponema primitia ZAS-2]|uniref:Galactofuranosyltransferase GlfT2 N-terminal domain-containing protein n=1 Tax=Treponema primitia (strain ATCC BAA-887 / DSM 12427 / ZAS-2) TaxID=545694 RepID=F5YGP1_TREPZ|nr:glycosyltransferase [Treponema primitia]AEF85579.1 hypothetical protein TREPR_2536 [Treponema primitia ZAS-2]